MTFNPASLPQFSQPAAVAPTAQTFLAAPAAAQAAPVAAVAPSYDNPFAGMSGAKVWEGNKPRLPIFHLPYRVRVDRLSLVKLKTGGRSLAIDFTVVQSANPDVPVGSQWGTMQGLGDIGMNYVLCWLCDVMGVSKSDKAVVAQVTAVSDAIMLAATTGVAQQKNGATFEPSLVLGREVMVLVARNEKSDKYNHENWSIAA